MTDSPGTMTDQERVFSKEESTPDVNFEAEGSPYEVMVGGPVPYRLALDDIVRRESGSEPKRSQNPAS